MLQVNPHKENIYLNCKRNGLKSTLSEKYFQLTDWVGTPDRKYFAEDALRDQESRSPESPVVFHLIKEYFIPPPLTSLICLQVVNIP